MFGLSTAVSALRASQVAMETVGNNIANANTPDYHRQTVHFADRTPVLLGGHLLGRGVDVSHISRSYDSVTEAALTRSLHESADISTRLETARRIESFFQPGAGTLLDRLETFFNDLQRLSASPNDTGLRSIVVRGAAGLTEELIPSPAV